MSDSGPAQVNKRMIELAHSDISELVIQSFYHVYNKLGSGLPEAVYQEALAVAIRMRGLEVLRELPLSVEFEGHVVGKYRADLIVNRAILVETKAVEKLAREHEAQSYTYLKVARLRVALLMNFGPKPHFKRLILPEVRDLPRTTQAGR